MMRSWKLVKQAGTGTLKPNSADSCLWPEVVSRFQPEIPIPVLVSVLSLDRGQRDMPDIFLSEVVICARQNPSAAARIERHMDNRVGPTELNSSSLYFHLLSVTSSRKGPQTVSIIDAPAVDPASAI